MHVSLECLPCNLRQAFEASKLATDDADAQGRIMDEVMDVLRRHREYPNSPAISRDIHRIVKFHTGNADPYAAVKRRDLETALSLLPQILRQLEEKDGRLYWALKIAAAGNAMDSAVGTRCDSGVFEAEVFKPFVRCDLPVLREKLETAESLLLIGDNTGESVFDALLLAQLPALQRIYAVRSVPVLNDVTAEEARASGIKAHAEILPTGCEAPGVLLPECSEAFLERFYGADLVIAKGQGNFETLSDCPRDMFFLLKAKCPLISRQLDVELNDTIFQYKPFKS